MTGLLRRAFSGRRSLSGRLVRRIIAIQVTTVLLGMFAWMSFSRYVGYEDLAAESAQRLVVESLSRDADGEVRLRPSVELTEYAARRPGFAFGAIVEGRPLPGSSPVLLEAMDRLGSYLPIRGKLEMPSPTDVGTAKFVTVHHHDGPVGVVTAGNSFRAEDASAFFSAYLPQLLAMFGPALFGAALVVPWAVRRSLRPLRRAANHAAEIEYRSLDGRLPTDGLTAELVPFVEAINSLLDRLETGIARQHLFTANAAHELRTPAAILVARIDALPEGPVKQELKRDSRRLTVLLDQLLSAARLGQREVDANEEVDLIACARDIVADCAPLALRGGRRIELEADVGSVRLIGNAQALSSAIANLVDNALRMEPASGTVIVRVTGRDAESNVRLEVVDHGPGIPETDRSLVFDPFWRRDGKLPGTGLGLAIVAEVVRMHGGSVWIQDTPGGGATFILQLPVLYVEASPTPPRQSRAMLAG